MFNDCTPAGILVSPPRADLRTPANRIDNRKWNRMRIIERQDCSYRLQTWAFAAALVGQEMKVVMVESFFCRHPVNLGAAPAAV